MLGYYHFVKSYSAYSSLPRTPLNLLTTNNPKAIKLLVIKFQNLAFYEKSIPKRLYEYFEKYWSYHMVVSCSDSGEKVLRYQGSLSGGHFLNSHNLSN